MGNNLLCDLLLRRDIELDIRDRDAVAELDACSLEVVHHRRDEVRELVAAAELQCREVGKAAYMMDEAVHVELHLEGGVPVLEREHRAPVAPEVGMQQVVREDLLNRLALERLVAHHQEVRKLHRILLAEVELAVVVALATVRRDAAV